MGLAFAVWQSVVAADDQPQRGCGRRNDGDGRDDTDMTSGIAEGGSLIGGV